MHLEIDSLVRYRDGGATEAEKKSVEAHLAACPECRQEYDRLADALTPEIAGADDPACRMLERLVDQMHSWQKEPRRAGAIKERIAPRAEAYLGRRGVERILASVSEDGDNLLSTMEPVLALFLGRSAAARLVDHFVEDVFVRL